MEVDNSSFTPDMLRFAVEHAPDGSKVLDLLGKRSIELTVAECKVLAALLTESDQDPKGDRGKVLYSSHVADNGDLVLTPLCGKTICLDKVLACALQKELTSYVGRTKSKP